MAGGGRNDSVTVFCYKSNRNSAKGATLEQWMEFPEIAATLLF
jgi:hypothetical protein